MSKVIEIVITIIVLIFCCGLIVFLIFTSVTKPREEAKILGFQVEKGLAFVPKAFDEAGIEDFWDKAEECCSRVIWNGAVTELGDENSGAVFVTKTAPTHNLKPIMIAVIEELDNMKEQEYSALIINYVKAYKPEYIGIGNEINRVFKDEKLIEFKTWFEKVYSEIKAVDPSIQVFTIFQFENLRGLNGGLFGGTNDPTLARWDLFELFKTADLFGFTSYPGLIYTSPAEVPENYLADIHDYTDKEYLITETAWFREGPSAEWQSSTQEQQDYIARIPKLVDAFKPKLIIWPFLYDLETPIEPFTKAGLISRDQAVSGAFTLWKDITINSLDSYINATSYPAL